MPKFRYKSKIDFQDTYGLLPQKKFNRIDSAMVNTFDRKIDSQRRKTPKSNRAN